MRKLLKGLLPPLAGFGLYFIAVRYSGIYFQLQIDQIGEGTVQGFMAFYKYFLPLLFVVALLTQMLIIVPLWNRLRLKSPKTKFYTFLGIAIVCLLFAVAISYVISDARRHMVLFIHLLVFMTIVELFYWAINIALLYLIDHNS